jgi:urate oxidase
MGETILGNFDNVSEIHLSLPSRQFNLANLAALGMDNPGTVFLATDENHTVTEATLKRS